jgi:hypothetical protein
LYGRRQHTGTIASRDDNPGVGVYKLVRGLPRGRYLLLRRSERPPGSVAKSVGTLAPPDLRPGTGPLKFPKIWRPALIGPPASDAPIVRICNLLYSRIAHRIAGDSQKTFGHNGLRMVQFVHTVARFVHSAVGELNSRRSRKIIGNSEIPEISLGGPTDLQRPAHFPTQNMQFRCVEAIRELPCAHGSLGLPTDCPPLLGSLIWISGQRNNSHSKILNFARRAGRQTAAHAPDRLPAARAPAGDLAGTVRSAAAG